MRIISGRLGGRRIASPPGEETRPTSERVREALFSILGPPPPGARILDLFAGSGALAFEALSRGAEAAVAVETSRAGIRAIRENARDLGLADRVEIRRARARDALSRLRGEVQTPTFAGPFSWVFLDPPYGDADAAAVTLALLEASPILAPGAVIALEHDRRRSAPDPERGFLVKADYRRYGDTALTLYHAPP